MKFAVGIGGYDHQDLHAQIAFVVEAERLGADCVWSAEGWGEDAVTSLAYLAAKTSRIRLATGIMQISARVPAMTAMTAQSMALLSGDRFMLGLGVSGPQVVEGLHGSSYEGPLTRLRENVEIVRMALAGRKIEYQGKYHRLPRPGGEGKALRLDHPPRAIPVYLATISPRALEYTGAAADGWLGACFSPDHAEAHLEHLRRGAVAAGRELTALDLHMPCFVAIGEDVEGLIDARRAGVAFSLGAMGSGRTNFYNDAYCRAGFTDDAKAVQSLWIDGKREAAAARVTDDMVTQFSAIGTESMVRERLSRYRDAGIDCLVIRFVDASPAKRLPLIEQIGDMLKNLA